MNVTKRLVISGWGSAPQAPHMVEAEIDIDTVLWTLGNKALRNRSKKTRALAGLIKVAVRPCQESVACEAEAARRAESRRSI